MYTSHVYPRMLSVVTNDRLHNVLLRIMPQTDGAPSAMSIFKRDIKPQIRETEDVISDGELSERAEDMWFDLPNEQKVTKFSYDLLLCQYISLQTA